MKPCTVCRRVFPLEHYYRDLRAKDGRQSRCRGCYFVRTGSRFDICACGARKLKSRAVCHDCRDGLTLHPDPRPRCQHVRCDLPVAHEGARGCALHWPQFEGARLDIAAFATAGLGRWPC